MMNRYAAYLLMGAMTAGAGAMTVAALPAAAQQIPPGQSCGGLLCDMGMFGHKVPVNTDGSPPTPAQIAVADKQVAAVEATDPHRLPCHDFLCRAFGGKNEQQMAEAAQAATQAAQPPVPAAEPEQPAKHAHKAKRKHVAKAETAADAAAAPAAK